MSRKNSFLILKILIGIGCFGFIAYRLKNQFTPENTSQLKVTFSQSDNIRLLIISLLLMFFNWATESLKWKIITSPIERVTLTTSWKSVLSGLCVGNLTPGRIGEFAGRIIFFSPGTRSRVSVTHFVCGLTQLFVTVVVGILALCFLMNSEQNSEGSLPLILISCGFLLLLLSLLVLNINRFYSWLSGLKWMKRFDLGKVIYSRKIVIQLLALSALRYFIFSTQYFLLLKTCGVRADNFQVFCSIAVSFMLMSSIPMISFIEVAIRAAIAVMLFGQFQQNSLQLISASTLLWLINIVIPSVIGYVYLVREKIELSSFRKPQTK